MYIDNNSRYDHNINYCHEMSPEEQEELFMFVESRKEKAQGQGEVKSFKKKSKKVCLIVPSFVCRFCLLILFHQTIFVLWNRLNYNSRFNDCVLYISYLLQKCDKCGGLVDCAVIADKIPGRVWHPGCFSCTTCEEVLVDLIYFQVLDNISRFTSFTSRYLIISHVS